MPILIVTNDGSHSLMMDDVHESYHSRHGALTESMHVFIRNGLFYLIEKNSEKNTVLNILEVGLGTGLNCLLTFIEAQKKEVVINYTALEPFPLSKELTTQLNYPELLGEEHRDVLNIIHESAFGDHVMLTDDFCFEKYSKGLKEFTSEVEYDLVYFDAFAPAVAPDLWTVESFSHLASMMRRGGVLVTYCAKGSVRRAMKEAGFTIEKLDGPPGKREMTRAYLSEQD